jgi:hypothetical protein
VTTTMSAGGEDSLAARIRDALVEAGKTRATVWGHTEQGHTTRNPSLRRFDAHMGKGTKGSSYVGETVFGTIHEILSLGHLEATLRGLGFAIGAPQQEALRRAARKQLRRLWYLCYVRANIKVPVRTVGGKRVIENNLTFRGANLSEMAPTHPLEVADIVRRYWSNVCWSQAKREKAARELAKELRLKPLAHSGIPAIR